MNVYNAVKWINDHKLNAIDPLETALRSTNALQYSIVDYNFFDCEMHVYDLHRCVASWVDTRYDVIYNIQPTKHSRDSFDDKHVALILATMQTLASKIVAPYSQQLQWFVMYLNHIVNYFIGTYDDFVTMLPYIYTLRKLRVIDNKAYNCLLIHKAIEDNVSIANFPEYVRSVSKRSFLFTSYKCCGVC